MSAASPSSAPPAPGRACDRGPDRAGAVCLILAVVAAVFLVGAFVWSAGRGFDLTDEGFHLNTIRHYTVAPQGGSQFGSVVALLTFGRTLTVAGYRLFGLVLLEISAAFAALALVRFVDRRMPGVASQLPPTTAVVAIAMVGGTLGFSWLPRTVSYLVLTPVLLCLIAALCLIAMSTTDRTLRLGRIDVAAGIGWGVAGSLLFYTKFPSAAAGLVLSVIALVAIVGWRRGAAVTAVVGGTFVVVTFVLNGLGSFDLSHLFESASALGGGSHSSSALQTAYVNELRRLIPSTVVGAVAFALVLVAPIVVVRLGGPRGAMAAIACLAVGAIGFSVALGSSRPPWDLSPIVVFAVLGGIGLAILGEWFVGRDQPRSPADEAPEATVESTRDVPAWIALLILLIGLPFAGSIGTNTGLLELSLSTGALLALAFVILFATWRTALPDAVRGHVVIAVPLGLALLCFTFVVGRSLTRDLYRVSYSAGDQTQTVHNLAPLEGVRVDAATRDLIDQTVAVASRRPGVKPGSPILTSTDLEGLAYVLDGYVPGAGWIDASDTTCVRLQDARAALAKTNLMIIADPLGKHLDTCFRRVVPGYPKEFAVIGTIQLTRPLQLQLGVPKIEVLRRG